MLALCNPRLKHDGHLFESCPEGQVFGEWSLKKFSTPPRQYIYLLDDFVESDGPIIQTAIVFQGDQQEIIMSDLPFEVYVQRESVKNTEGTVLICGLGMGMVLRMLEKRPQVEKIVVVEKSKDLLDFVGDIQCSKPLEIINGDIYDCVGDIECDWAVFDHFGPLEGNDELIKQLQASCKAPNHWYWDSGWWAENL